MHDHNVCDHELKYCDRCDIVYCEKCNSEWGKLSEIANIHTPKAVHPEDKPTVYVRVSQPGDLPPMYTPVEYSYPFGK